MPIKSIACSELSFAEVASVAKKLSVIISKAPKDAVLLNQLNEDMQSKVSTLEERSGKKAQLILEETPAMADEKRDRIYNQILKYVKGNRHSPLPGEAQAAEQIYELLVQHNTSLANMSYDIESHYLNALLVDLKKTEFQEHIKTLSLEKIVSDLENAQRKFEEVNSRKLEQNASFDLPQLHTLVSPIRSVLFEILVHLGTIERLNPDVYKTIINETNELLTEVGSKVKARRTRKSTAQQTV